LTVEVPVLTGEKPVSDVEPPYDVTLSEMKVEVSTLARNAFFLVTRCYNVTQPDIVS
jgi:hypothetical protein